jgi:3-deoxy-7-phosphoheptulonate synthase/chorismate mutase
LPLNSGGADQLLRWRAEINDLNARLLDLLEARGRLVESIAALKRHHRVEIHDPDRENAMLAAVLARTTGPFSNDQVARVFRCIFDVSRELASRDRD